MALLNRFFVNRRKNVRRTTPAGPDYLNSTRWIAPAFDKNRIRVLVYRECEDRGRKLLFDIFSIRKVDANPNAQAGCSEHETYQYTKPCQDVSKLGEMMFGSVALSYDGVTLKVHNDQSDLQLMISKVFSAPLSKSKRTDRNLSGAINLQKERIPKSPSENLLSESFASSVPVNIPIKKSSKQLEDELKWTTSSSLRTKSALESYQNKKPRSSVRCFSSLGNLPRSGSYNTLHRRWLRTQLTSIECGVKPRFTEESKQKRVPRNSKTKLGVSIVIYLGKNKEEEKKLKTFFFSHFAIIESYLDKICVVVENFYPKPQEFVHSVVEATEKLRQSLYDLYTTPRFPEPVWLSMMTQGAHQQPVCQRFMGELMNLLNQHDSKTTNFFMSTLLTAVLTHHLAWVPTVTPPDNLPKQPFYKKHTAKWLDILAKQHPYNPLWVQLGDLYGALGKPCKMARTVIVGKNADLVKRIIYCLTYFIRCCEVSEKAEYRKGSTSSTSSGNTLVNESSSTVRPRTASEDTIKQNVWAKSTLSDKYEPKESLVVRQDGEGDDEEDEVFLSGIRDKLRFKSYCNKCPGICHCRDVNRNGFVCDNGIEDCKTQLTRVGTGNGQLCDIDTLKNDHDSGVDFDLDNDERAKVRVLLSKDHVKSKKRTSNGRVVFTIGNIPLEEIYDPLQKEDNSCDFLVCTCGKHMVGKENKENVPVNVLLTNTNNESSNIINLQKENVSALDSSTNEPFSSSRCDSGIHSCDQSVVDLLTKSSLTAEKITSSVEALQINIPLARREHIRNVGKAQDYQKIASDIAFEEILQIAEKKTPRVIKYERTNSMFDEYFDENVELKVLDEESFQQKLRLKRENLFNSRKDRSARSEFVSVVDQEITQDICSNQDQVSQSNTESSHLPSNSASKTPINEPVNSNLTSCARLLWNLPPHNPIEVNDFFDRVSELPVPESETRSSINSCYEYYRGFGWSLTSNYSDHYMTDFALQGTSQTDFGSQLLSDLKMAVCNPILDETVTDAVAIVADTDNWTVQILTNKHGTVTETGAPQGSRVMMSQLVSEIMDSLTQLWDLKMPADFCLMHLEDRLQELYFKSRLLTEYTATMKQFDLKSIIQALGMDTSDLPLLLGIASIHSPQIINTSCSCT